MLVVVVVEETAAEQPAVFGGTKTARKLRTVLHRLELGLGVGIVVRDVRSGVGLGNSEVSQEQSHGLASHRAATVRVKGELVGFNVLLATALGDEALRERRTFSVSQHPANHVAGEDVAALLRREALYSSHLSSWRRQRDEVAKAGLASRKRGRKAKAEDPRVKELERENARLQRRLARVETMLEIQKKPPNYWGSP